MEPPSLKLVLVGGPRQGETLEFHQEPKQVFMKFDVNGDGKIPSAELGSIMASLGHQPTEEELDTMIKEFDADGDGYINFQEFVALNTQGLDDKKVMENLKEAFSVYDIEGDGSISAEDESVD